MQIYVCGKRAIVHWGDEKRLWSLTSDGVATEQSHVQGELVWWHGEPAFDSGYAVGYSDGYEAGARDVVETPAEAS